MKKILLTLVLMVGIVLGLFAQKLTYQAVIRDNNQQLVVNTAVKATVTITFATGDPYSEEVNGSTNIHGLLSFEFGDATLVGRDWTGATIAVKVVKANDEGIVYVNDEPRPVSAVPYALSVDGQSIQKYLEEKHYVDLTKLNDTLDAYSTTAAMDARHYLTSDSAVIKTMQNNISRNANSIDNLILHTAKAAIRDSVAGQINDSISNIAAKAHTHDNKALLDTYTQTEANLAEAVSKKHSHDNMTVLNATTAPYTDADSTKLDGIAAGAEVNVQSDWKQTDGSKDDYIKNKPSIRDTVNNILTTGKYVTETTLDARHYLTSDSTVITTMQGHISTNKTNIQTNAGTISALTTKEQSDSLLLAGRIDALENASMDCNDVKDCIKDTLSKYTMTDVLNGLLQQLEARLTGKIDSLAHVVDSLAKLPHGGDTTAFTCGTDSVKDVDNNWYHTVKIGNQCWMKENLRTDVDGGVYPKKNNGQIALSEDEQVIYGRLYTWSAMMNSKASSDAVPSGVQGICPTGWHVPSDAEWDTLTHYVFNSTSPDYKCGEDCGTWQAKSNVNCIAKALASTTGWDSNTSEGCNAGNMGDKANATGFSAVPAGVCFDGNFLDFGGGAYFWSATQGDGSNARYRGLYGHVSRVYWYNDGNKGNGFSVRCLRDAGTGGGGTTPVPVEVSCEQVMECMGDTLGKLNTKIEAQGAEIETLNGTVTTQGLKLDSLAHLVDSLSRLIPGGDTTEVADGQPCPGAPTVSDGTNTYNTVKIGNQCWMKENLRTTTGLTENTNYWHANNQSANDETYGLLYNWAAVMQGKSTTNYPVSGDKVRGICPAGWHVPSNAEWTQLTTYVNSVADYKCNNVDNNIANALSIATGWQNSSECGAGHGGSTTLNATGFSAVPAGNWLYDFSDFGGYAYFWSATEGTAPSLAWPLHLHRYNSIVISGEYSKDYGFSVRCLKDEGGSSATLPTVTTDSASTVTNNSAKLYGNVTDMGEKTEVNAGFKYGTSESTLTSIVVKDAAMTATCLFSCDITGLTANTQYYYKAFAANGTDTVYGEVKDFTTVAASTDGQPCPGAATVSDGTNTYNTVKIGNQCWMKENLRTTTKRNNVGNIYTNNTTDGYNAETYGYYYNWAAVMQNESGDTVRGICPEGWHVPSDAEWTQLTDYVKSKAEYKCGDGADNIANALSSSTGWQSPSDCGAGHNSTTLNATGFSAVPAGGWFYGDFYDFGGIAYFWSATQYDGDYAWYRGLGRGGSDVSRDYDRKVDGFSVRCLKDEGGSSATLPTVTTDSASTVTNNSAKLYGNVTDMGGKDNVYAGFKYGTSESTLTTIVVKDAAMTATDQFSCDITNLTANTQYYFKAFAANGTDTVYGVVKNFTTAAAVFTCGTDKVKDVDNNEYNTVKIGNQCWMKENLRTTTKRNNAGTIYTNNTTEGYNAETYGYYYSWAAVMQNESGDKVQGICPTGWHVPSDAEWTQLTDYVKSKAEYKCGVGDNNIANALSAATGWTDPQTCCAGHSSATLNKTGFSAVPAGPCYGGNFDEFGFDAVFWSATQVDDNNAWYRSLYCYDHSVYCSSDNKTYGFSVRCLKN